MSEQALIERFDLVLEYSENLPLIRRYIVDLAIRGRLVAPLPEQLSPVEMLKRIAQRAAGLAREGNLNRQKLFPPIQPGELPPAYAEHCMFERLGNVATLRKGLTGIQAAKPGPYQLVVTAADRASCDHFDFDGAAAIIPMVSSTGHGHASLNRLHYQEGKFALGTILCAAFPIDEELISARFLFEYLTAFKEELLVARMIGTANVSLTVAKIGDVTVPVLPTAVLKRVEELMSLCDRLETAYEDRELRRDRLAAASLHRLNQPVEAEGPERQREYARFHLRHLPRLTTRPDQIKALRNVILNQAVRGRLVAQEAADEPAEKLLNRVRTDIQLYGTENKVHPASVDQVTDDDVPFALPASWVWTRFASVCRVITDGDHLPPPKADAGVAFLTIGNVSTGKLDFTNCRYVPHDYFDKIAAYRRPANGDLLYTVVGATYGRPVIVDTAREFCVQRHIAIVKPAADVLRSYLYLLLISPFVYDQATRSLTGTAQPTVPLRPLRNFLMPLPPLAEQHRIVARMDCLMALCDQLEARLITIQTDSRRLLENLLDRAVGIARVPSGPKVVSSQSDELGADQQTAKASSFMAKNPALTVDELVKCINDLGGATTPERLLQRAGLSGDLEAFYDLLRAARDSGRVTVPLGAGAEIGSQVDAN